MSEEVEIKRVKFNKCPRCGSHNISHKRLNKDGMTSDSYSSLENKWNKTKEERINYVIPLLKKHGNAYIGAIDKTIWSDDNLEQYLTEQVGKEIGVDEIQYELLPQDKYKELENKFKNVIHYIKE